MTKVSVIVPAYNVAPFLHDCLDSLIAQTYTDVEIVVVNDGSTDHTGEIAEGYRDRDPRVRVVQRANGGLSAARNSGLDVATGSLISFVDADDWCDPEMLQSMVDCLVRNRAQVVIAGMHVDYHDKDGQLIRSFSRRLPMVRIDPSSPLSDSLVDGDLVNLLGYAWNKLYRRDLIEFAGVRFVEGISLVEDVIFNADILRSAERVTFLDEAYVHYVQRQRLTLGTRAYPDLLDLRLMAIKSIDRALKALGSGKQVRNVTKAHMSQVALIMAVRSAASRPGRMPERLAYLRLLLCASGTPALFQLATTLPPDRSRDGVALYMLRKGHLRTALFLARLAGAHTDSRRRPRILRRSRTTGQ